MTQPQNNSPASILLAHGGGGVLTRELIEDVILKALGKPSGALPDAALLSDVGNGPLMFTTDSFVIKPLFFHGGNIGSLSVHGTVNDLAVSGAEPLALSMGLIIEEGLDIQTLYDVVKSAGEAAQECGVQIVTGDTKVVARGEADQLFINTAGIGRRCVDVSSTSLQPGDKVIVSGFIADHGVAVMSQREGIDFQTRVKSDSAAVWPLVKALIDAEVPLRIMRDPTRGGLAATCVELAGDSGVTILLDEEAIPVRPEVQSACDMLGLDPLTVANEGKVVVVVPAHHVNEALAVLHHTPDGQHAAIIGQVTTRKATDVQLRTRYGGERIVEMPYGEDLPRIC